MPAYTTLSNALVAVGARPFATTIQALRDNLVAVLEGDPTAPKIAGQVGPAVLTGGLADGCVTEPKIGNFAVAAGKLKTAVNSGSWAFGSSGGFLTISVNAYSFYPAVAGGGVGAVIDMRGAGGSADLPAITISAPGTSSGTARWRYMLP